MKKILSTLAMLLVISLGSTTFVACSSDDDDDDARSLVFLEDPHTTIVGRVSKLSYSGNATSWSSSNDFIASVKDEGIVTANHVGKCEVIALSGRRREKCTIDVKPIYTTYADPLVKWGASKAEVKAYEKRYLKDEDNNTLYYTIDNGVAKGLSYNFKDGKLVAVLVVIEHDNRPSVATELAGFMKERYRVISVSTTESYFSDGKDATSSTTLVYTQINPSGYNGYMWIYYIPYE